MSAPMHIPPAGGGPAPAAMDERAKARLQTAVREFEAMFVTFMLKSMRASMSSEEMFGDSFGGDMVEGMFDVELARQMSRNSSLGVGEMLYRKITGEKLPQPPPAEGGAPRPAPPEVRMPGPVLQQAAQPQQGPVQAAGAGSPALQALPVPAPQSALAVSTRREPPSVEALQASPRREGRIDQRLIPYEPIILEAAERHGLNPSLLKAVIASESSGNARAQSPKSAKGLMQLIDTTAADMGVRNVWDPRQNIFGGAKYLQQLLERFGGDLEKAIASYNAGPGAVEKHGGVPPYRETRTYVTRVLNFLDYFDHQEVTNDNK